MCKQGKYYNIEKRTLAETLNFMGFRYYKFIGDTGVTLYGFEDTDKFKYALEKILELRKKIRSL